MDDKSLVFPASDQLGQLLRVAPDEVVVTERADTGIRLGPFAKTKAVERAVETRQLAVLEVLGGTAFSSRLVSKIWKDALSVAKVRIAVLVLKEVIETTKEFKHTQRRTENLCLDDAFDVFREIKLMCLQLMLHHDSGGASKCNSTELFVRDQVAK